MLPSSSPRGHRRYAFPEGAPVSLRVDLPGTDGDHFDMPLRDLSATGLSFRLCRDLPCVERGATFPAVTIMIAHHRIRGNLVVVHVTRDRGAGPVCGALFLPASERDSRTLRAVIDWLESEVSRQSAEATGASTR